MSAYMIVFRIVHIGAAVLWVGGVFAFTFFVQPTARALGPEGGRFVIELQRRRRIADVILGLGAVTIAAGAFLYWRDSSGLDPDWITTDVGLGFTVGAVLAITAFVIGLFGTRPSVQRMVRLSGEVAASGGPPTEAQQAEIMATGNRLRLLGLVGFWLLAGATLAMAVARYL